jgi:RsiW-degrading membrane proteinase PrsW (M82 family)
MGFEPISIYYESKMQYYFFTIACVLFFSYITFFNINNFRDTSQNFLVISLAAVIFVYFYKASKFYIDEDRFVWEKGRHRIECSWNEVLSINYDIERNWSFSTPYLFKPSSIFFIETTKGLTKYADKSNIKLFDSYSFSSKGDELINTIKSRSQAREKMSAISVFKQTQKLLDWVLLLLAIFLIPATVILLYVFFTKDYSALSVFKDLF